MRVPCPTLDNTAVMQRICEEQGLCPPTTCRRPHLSSIEAQLKSNKWLKHPDWWSTHVDVLVVPLIIKLKSFSRLNCYYVVYYRRRDIGTGQRGFHYRNLILAQLRQRKKTLRF